MKNFAEYAQYYDLLYADKNYKKEADYVDSLIKRYSAKRANSLLDIGCGTGSHDFWFVKKGYKVAGIDKSGKMTAIAKKRKPSDEIEFFTSDASKFTMPDKFDTAVALFHVMSYLTTNAVFLKSLKNIHKHLKNCGILIFDFWYGPAVLTQKPVKKIKNMSGGGIAIRRTATPEINFNENTVNVRYKSLVLNKINGKTAAINEEHKMRYFFLPELYLMLGLAGFKVIKVLKWMSLTEKASERTWSAVIIAKK